MTHLTQGLIEAIHVRYVRLVTAGVSPDSDLRPNPNKNNETQCCGDIVIQTQRKNCYWLRINKETASLGPMEITPDRKSWHEMWGRGQRGLVRVVRWLRNINVNVCCYDVRCQKSDVKCQMSDVNFQYLSTVEYQMLNIVYQMNIECWMSIVVSQMSNVIS